MPPIRTRKKGSIWVRDVAGMSVFSLKARVLLVFTGALGGTNAGCPLGVATGADLGAAGSGSMLHANNHRRETLGQARSQVQFSLVPVNSCNDPI